MGRSDVGSAFRKGPPAERRGELVAPVEYEPAPKAVVALESLL
jgi:hypothetical protein